MATLQRIDFLPFGPYRIVGKEIRTRLPAANPVYTPDIPSIPALWQRCFSDGTYETLKGLTEHIPQEIPTDFVGYIRDFNQTDSSFTYVVGLFLKEDTPVPEGFVSYLIPATTIARTLIQGEEFDIYPNAHPLSVEAIGREGRKVNWQDYFACEVYTEERFCRPQREGEKILVLDYYLPCLP